MLNLFLLCLGFIFLIKGADLFVDGASSVAKGLRIPTAIIGLTIVAFGTSAPEAAVSITAAIQNNNEIAVGNILGSNIFNLMVVGGISALMSPLPVDKSMIKKDFPISIFAAILVLVLSFDNILKGGTTFTLSKIDGVMMLLVFGVFMYSTVMSALKSRRENMGIDMMDTHEVSMAKSVTFCILGIIGIVAGGQLVVESATQIARYIGVSDTLIGLTVVAVGTSLPELVTSIVAAKKGETDIALTNIVGSNIFNILFILGASSAISGISIATVSMYDAAILVFVSVIAYLVIARKKFATRGLGMAMLVSYLGYTGYIIYR